MEPFKWSKLVVLVSLVILTFNCVEGCKILRRVFQSRTHKSGYQGCFVDKEDSRDLKYHADSSNEMTLKVCNDLCKEIGGRYYGTQSGTECYCGDSFGSYGKQDDDYCDRACMGFLTDSKVTSAIIKSEFCGGDKMNSVYEVK